MDDKNLTEMMRLITARDAAKILGVTPGYLAKLRCYVPESGPRFVRVGKRGIRYKLADLESFIAERSYGGGRE